MIRSAWFPSTLILMGLSCSNPNGKPPVHVYVPRFATYSFTLTTQGRRYKISHDYLDFNRSGEPRMGGCNYGYGTSTPELERDGLNLAGDMFEEDGHIFQMQNIKKEICPRYMDRFVIGSHTTSRLGGGADKRGIPYPVIVNELIRTDPIAYDRIGGLEFDIYLHKCSALTVADSLAQDKRLLDTGWAETSKWYPEESIQRGENQWILFKTVNRAMYLGDMHETWYLPIADNKYYYRVCFTYQSALLRNGSDQYSLGRAILDRILDSFKVEEIQPDIRSERSTMTAP